MLNPSNNKMILISIVLSIIVVFGLIAVSRFVFDVAGLDNTQWSNLEALASACVVGFAVGAGIRVLREVEEAADSRNLEIYRDIYAKFMSGEAIDARRYIYRKKPSDQEKNMIEAVENDQHSKDCIKQILNQFDYFGFLVEQDWVTSEQIIGWLSPVVVKVWEKIGPIVELERTKRPEEPDYYISAVRLAELCRAWRDAHYPKRPPITFDDHKL